MFEKFKKAWETCSPFLWALGAMALGYIGIVTGEFWTPRARRSVHGPFARFLGAIALALGAIMLIVLIFAVMSQEPDPDESAPPALKRFARPRKRKPRPIDPGEQIAAEALGLNDADREDERDYKS
jgi:hypothetical protein